MNLNLSLCAACGAPYLYLSADEGEPSEQELFQDLLAGSEDGPLKPYLAKSRWICPSIHPFLDLTRVFYAGLPEEERENLDDADDNEYTEKEIKAFSSIMKLERGFRTIVSACSGDVRHILALINKVSSAASGLRSDDTTKLKSAILSFIHEDPKRGSIYATDHEMEILVASDAKDLRGFKHVDTAAHLCPLRLKADFDKDPLDFMDRVEDGSIQITDEDFPSFVYESETLYDEDNEDIGLFRGYLLVRVYRSIFTGPTSAMNPTAKVNKSKAKKFKLTEVTGRTIAYASVQAYIALSSMSQWGSSDNLFNLQLFYDAVVEMFERDPNDSWVVDTLEWWKEQIPGLQPKMSKRNKQVVENRTRPDLVERIFAQRARHSKITANNQELSRRSEGAMGEEELDAEEENDQARRREAEMKELADQQGETAHTRSLLPKLTNLPSGSSMPHSQPAAAAKRHADMVSESNSEPELDENSDPSKKRHRVATTSKAKGKRVAAARKGKKRK